MGSAGVSTAVFVSAFSLSPVNGTGKVFLMCDAHRLLRHTGDITDGAIVFGYKLFSRSANF